MEECQSSNHLTENEAQDTFLKAHSVEEPPHMCKNQTRTRTLIHSILCEGKKLETNLVWDQENTGMSYVFMWCGNEKE